MKAKSLRQTEAVTRNEARGNLTIDQAIQQAKQRPGESKRELARLTKLRDRYSGNTKIKDAKKEE